MGDQPAIPYLLAVFALVGGLWLVAEHRTGESIVAFGIVGNETERVPLKVPYREALLFGSLAIVAMVVAFAGPKRVMLAMGELMPTSGGTGTTDPFARYGVGDGPEEVAGDNAKAAGMVESDNMIEDNKNSLIDAVNDMYGPPHKPNPDQERMVAAGKVDVIENHGKLPENRRPSRDFDTGRKGPSANRKPESRTARGLIEVEGRTPLHIRVAVYDRYDPKTARWIEARKPTVRMFDADGGDWMKIANVRQAAWVAETDSHRLKVADLKQNLVPTPSQLNRFRIQRVDKPDYYEWDYEGVLILHGRSKTPPGVVVATECRTLDPQTLPGDAFSRSDHPGSAAPVYVDVPQSLRHEFDRLASDWAGHLPHGWPQIEAILGRLKSHYALEPTATPPADHPAPALWFLTESHCGPDYLFATSAALLLRSLGYPTRFCIGFYASPEAYDRETDHTPVKNSDLHLWPEVLLRDGHWMVVEPTPGYSVLTRKIPWREQILTALRDVAAWGSRNAIGVAVGFIAILFVVVRRSWLLDRIRTIHWQLAPGPSWQTATLRAARLLERRGVVAGVARRPDQTLSAWAVRLNDGPSNLQALMRLAERAAYAPDIAIPSSETEELPKILRLCRNTLTEWPIRKFSRCPAKEMACS
jgi:protein-glutamine gamma-glutamyltransferase